MLNNLKIFILALFVCSFNLAFGYGHLSPFAYCANNPIKYVDPNGCEVRGVSREDAANVVQDIRAIFPGDDFEKFRNLIVQTGKKHNGYSLAKISDEALMAALTGLTLNEDQQAMVDIVVNTINSPSKHYIEYLNSTGVLSLRGVDAISPQLASMNIDVQGTINKFSGIPSFLVESLGGGGITTPIINGTHSIILMNTSLHPNGISVTTGHEIFGHGRSLSLGRTSDIQQHIDAIQTENLILRMMGIQFVNSGIGHGLKIEIPNPSALPAFR